MKKVLIKVFCLAFLKIGISQNCQTHDLFEIPLDKFLAKKETAFEFSSMALWKNLKTTKVLLVPAMKKELGKQELYTVDSFAIAEILCAKTINPLKVVDTIIIEGKIFAEINKDSNYDGIEATCVIGDDIYFAVETKKAADYCYILKGRIKQIDKQNKYVIKIEKKVEIKKDIEVKKKTKDAGFESMAFYGGQFWVIFEKYDYSANVGTLYYKVDTNLQIEDAKGYRLTNLPEQTRLSEISVTNNNQLVGFVTKQNVTYALSHLEKDSFVMKKSIFQNDKSKDLNWEGMIPFMDGFLLINDNDTAGNRDTTKLLFVKHKN